jgi:LacI family transcriptional regulator
MNPPGRESKQAEEGFGRLPRPVPLTARVEQILREAIAEGRFPDGRLPTEAVLAEQLGVSRETVRLAAEVLQREGLLVKIRRKGTFLQQQALPDRLPAREVRALGYLQAGYSADGAEEEVTTRLVNGLLLQGALEEASRAGYRLVVQHAAHTQIGQAYQTLTQEQALAGLIFASFGEEKLLRRVAGTSRPVVLLDHDLHLANVHSVRDDSFQGGRDAVLYLAGLGHRRIAFLNWRQEDLNPWRLQGYRQGLRNAALPRRRCWELAVELSGPGAGKAAAQVLALRPRPTALYCFNNALARRVMEELLRLGVRVPEEMSVLGGGGEEVPGLACHQADWHQMGRLAVEVALRALQAGPEAPAEHHLSPNAVRPGASAAGVGG